MINYLTIANVVGLHLICKQANLSGQLQSGGVPQGRVREEPDAAATAVRERLALAERAEGDQAGYDR